MFDHPLNGRKGKMYPGFDQSFISLFSVGGRASRSLEHLIASFQKQEGYSRISGGANCVGVDQEILGEDLTV